MSDPVEDLVIDVVEETTGEGSGEVPFSEAPETLTEEHYRLNELAAKAVMIMAATPGATDQQIFDAITILYYTSVASFYKTSDEIAAHTARVLKMNDETFAYARKMAAQVTGGTGEKKGKAIPVVEATGAPGPQVPTGRN